MGITLACSLSAPTPIAWVGTPTAAARIQTQTAFANTQAIIQTSIPAIPPTKTVTALKTVQTPVPTPGKDGPWLIYPGKNGDDLHAFDIDTGNDWVVTIPDQVILSDLRDGLSPDCTQLLIRAGNVNNLDELALYKIENPHTDAQMIKPLLSVFIQREFINSQDERSSQALRGVTQPGGIAWTQDGHLVAFSAALDGDSSDIYLYDPEKQIAERMTVRYRQTLTPFWSPDAAWLIFQEATYISQDGKWTITAVSEVSMPDYDQTKFLYAPPQDSYGDVVVGWLNSQVFLSYSTGPAGAFQLRQVDLGLFKHTIVFDKPFNEIAFDPEARLLAINIKPDNSIDSGFGEGIYLSTTGGSPFQQLLSGEYDRLQWSEEGRLFMAVGNQGVIGFSPSQTQFTLGAETHAAIAPNRNWVLGWNDDPLQPGLRLYNLRGNLLQTITDQTIKFAAWQPDSKGVIFVTKEALFQAKFPLLEPQTINSIDVFEGEGFPHTWLNSN